MLKKRAGRKFSRNTNSRRAMFRSLVRNLVLSGSITTTVTRAKTVSGIVDGIFRKAKRGTLSDKRSIMAELGNDGETFKSIFQYMTLIESRDSGFTRQTKIENRRGDNAPMVKFELASPRDEIKEVKKAVKEKKSS